MFKKFFFLFLSLILFVLLFPKQIQAIDNPLSKPNNKVGMHVFFPSEVYDATKLINSNNGDWGYITVPIQTTDRDLKKWQDFMYACKKNHIIPILRLTTISDPTNTSVWKKPQLTDVIDIANFLNKLSWPTQNRYIIIFNEANRGDEWGGAINPSEYANILSFAVTVFKSKSPDFFIISSGLDNAAPNQGLQFMNQYEFMRQMNVAVPAIFHQIDGLASHAYPNPGFTQPPNPDSKMGIASFKYERALAKELTGKELPVFITETGWSAELISDELKMKYYQEAFDTIWNDPGIVAITPFIFEARSGPFEKFSFRTSSGSATKQYETFENMVKVKGEPVLSAEVLAAETAKLQEHKLQNNTSQISHIAQNTKKLFHGYIASLLKTIEQ